MSLVTVAEVRALVSTDLSDDDLQDVIDREEAELAHRIGPLTGARTETFTPDHSAHRLYLRRPTNAVTVTSDGEAVTLGDDDGEYRLVKHGSALHLNNNTWGGTVTAAYTPNDELRVRRVLIELIRLTTTETGYVSERIGQYSYSKAQTPGASQATREALIQTLIPTLGLASMRLQGSISPRPVPLET
jgi:hypothetical protein